MVRPYDQDVSSTSMPSKTDWEALGVSASAVSVASVVSDRLEQMIRTGQLPEASRLPSERHLAELLGVSRGSVREAIQTLWLKGLVHRKPGRGTVVAAHDAQYVHFITRLYDRLNGADRSLVRIMDYREAIEPPIAARAAQRAKPTDIRRLSELVVAMEQERSPRRVAELDEQFHSAIAQATDNPLFMELVEFSAEWMHSTRAAGMRNPGRRTSSIASHRAIVAAIAARDPSAAADAMEHHLGDVADLIESDATANPVRRSVAARSTSNRSSS